MQYARTVRIFSPTTFRRSFSSSSPALSGHNKWSKIKKAKGAHDRQKSAIYQKAARDIVVAARAGGSPDPEKNASLAAVIKSIKASGVPKDNIENALKKVSGDGGKNGQYQMYEALFGGSIGIIIECLTDNTNRTLHSLGRVIRPHGARLGSVSYLFDRKGSVKILLAKGDDLDARLERIVEVAFEAEAEDFEQTEPENSESADAVEVEFTCPPTVLAKVASAVTAPGLCKELVGSELVYVPKDPSEAPDEETATRLSELVEELEDDEDVLRVWTTLD
ncbi:YebC-like protein [Abortiporus biennis]|nr:YebC-like protein [Abortiporus biennis]